MLDPKVFKAYDVRGIYPEEIDDEGAYAIGRAYVQQFEPRRIAVGRDMRLSSPHVAEAVVRGAADEGAEVLDLGLVGTEMVYFAVGKLELDGGIMVTASHNPKEYTGMKIVRRGALPVGTGNKTERLMGYFTWHADDTPPVNPIGDLYKTQVWALARHLGVPNEVVDKAPSADLEANQTDEGDLGITYAKADRILNLILLGYRDDAIVARGCDASDVRLVRRRERDHQLARDRPIADRRARGHRPVRARPG